jgi:hypothetical protein
MRRYGILAVCADAPVTGKRIEIVRLDVLEGAGFVVYDDQPPPADCLVGEGNLESSPDVESFFGCGHGRWPQDQPWVGRMIMYDHIRAALRVSTGSELQAQIDLNARTPDGLTPVPTDLVTSGAQAGMVIRVFEPEDEVAGIGQIERIDRDAGLVYIRVDWNSIGDASHVEPIARSMSIVYGGPGPRWNWDEFRSHLGKAPEGCDRLTFFGQ